MRRLLAIAALVLSAGFGAQEKLSRRIDTEGAAGAYLVEFRPEVGLQRATVLARAAGLGIVPNHHLLPNHLLVTGDPERLRALAIRREVERILPASYDLLADVPLTACPGPLLAGPRADQFVTVGNGWPVSGSGGLTLGYWFANYTSKLDPGVVQAEVLRAFGEWSRYARIEFVPAAGANQERSVSILFASGGHADAYPFDGPGRVLAHTFYPSPPNPEPLAGDMHLDADEDWGTGMQTDLYTVVLHELGHALGLGHSDSPNSVMYPYYRLGMTLNDDDIAGIRALYGSRDDAAPLPLRLEVLTPSESVITTEEDSVTIAGHAQGGAGDVTVAWVNERGGQGAASGPEFQFTDAPLASGFNILTVTARDSKDATDSRVFLVKRDALAGPPTNPVIPPTNPVTPPTKPVTPPATPNTPSDEPASSDHTPPAMSITRPAGTIVSTSESRIMLRGTASDSAGIARVAWTNSAGGSGDCLGTTAWSADVALEIGNNLITIRAWDAAGNSSWRSVTIVRK